MATTINNNEEGAGIGMIFGIVIAVIIIALLFIYGLPAIRGNSTATTPTGTNVDIDLPASKPNVNTP